MSEKFEKFEVSEFLDNDEIIAEYLNVILDENDNDLLFSAIGDIAKAKGITNIAEKAGVGRESLYKSLASGSKPRFETVTKILRALDLSLTVEPRKAESKATKQTPPDHQSKISFAAQC